MIRALVAALALLTSGCTLVDDDAALAGGPCAQDGDCGPKLACSAGVCVPAAGAGLPPVGCQGEREGAPCSDGDPCTSEDTCHGVRDGACVGTPATCGDGEGCFAGACVDLSACTLGGEPAAVTTSTTPTADAPAIAWDGVRDVLGVAYVDGAAGVDEVWLQRVDESGAPVGPAVQVSDGAPRFDGDDVHPASAPALAFAPEAGVFGVAFAVRDHDAQDDVFAAVVDGDGVATPPAQLTSLHDAAAPRIAWNGRSFGVAWLSRSVDGQPENTSVVASTLFADGTTPCDPPCDGDAPVSDPGAVAPFSLVFDPHVASLVAAVRLEGDAPALFVGEAPTFGLPNLHRTVVGAGDPFAPALAVVPAGLAVAWLDDPGGTGAGAIDVAIVDDVAGPRAPSTVSDPGERCGPPALVATPAGLAVAYGAETDTGSEVRLRLLDDDGTPGPARVLGGGDRPAIAALTTGVTAAFVQPAEDGASAELVTAGACLAP